MRLLNVNGRPTFKNVEDKRVQWSGESKSKFQRGVKLHLRPLWFNNVVYEEFPIYGTKYTLDFFNATRKIAVEVQGIQHTKFTKYFQASQFDYLKQLKIDETKRSFCDLNGIKLVEVSYQDEKKLSTNFLKELGL